MKPIALGALAVLALCAAAPQPATRLHYTGYALGLPVMSFTIDLAQTDVAQTDVAQTGRAYDVAVDYRTTGVWGALFPMRRQMISQGVSTAAGPRPARVEVNSQMRGRVFHAVVRFGAGGPTVQILSAPLPGDDPRDRFQPIPAALTADSTDTISAVLAVLRDEAANGRCDADVHVFDGRMLSELQAASAPDDTIAADHGSLFAGTAHKCSFTGRMLAGFPPPPNDNQSRDRRPPPAGLAWIAPVGPAGAMLPVRVSFGGAGGRLLTFYLDARQAD
jgi:hypothetical protein